QMSGESGGNEEFLEQLRLQQLYGQSREAGNGDDPYTFVDPEDGTVYDWDQEKKAWFPKITEDFLAAYHANYGFNEEGTGKPSVSEAPAADPVAQKSAPQKPQAEGAEVTQPKEGKQKEKRKADPGWFNIDQEKNTNIYVSGKQEHEDPGPWKCRFLSPSISYSDGVGTSFSNELKNPSNCSLEGFCECSLFQQESLKAVFIWDLFDLVYHLRFSYITRPLVLQGDKRTSLSVKSLCKQSKLDLVQSILNWRIRRRGKIRCRSFFKAEVCCRSNLKKQPLSEHTQEDPLVLNEIREDLRTECEKFGQVKKVIIFDRHPDGVASVAFKEPEEADVCQLALDGRWFGGRKLSVQHWDGTTDYQVEETNREREERLKGWASFLGEKDSGKAGGEALKDSAGQAEKGAPQDPKSSTEEPPSKLEGPGTEHPEPGGAKEEAEGSGAGVSEEAVADSTDSSLAGSEEEEESEEA
uniref:HIV-1 Tat specific factor 1 n=1 Tax=Lepisosteus oculatus TaxID=7918 RepID=W5ND95_LEPOC